MTFFEKETQRIKQLVFSNTEQVEKVISIKRYIDEHYENDINLDLLSKNQFVSKFHLIRLFKRYYGQTPRQYLIDKRVEKSKEQLQKGLSVAESCFAVGFESVSSFSTLFKVRTGKSPSKYRKEQLSRSQSHLKS